MPMTIDVDFYGEDIYTYRKSCIPVGTIKLTTPIKWTGDWESTRFKCSGKVTKRWRKKAYKAYKFARSCRILHHQQTMKEFVEEAVEQALLQRCHCAHDPCGHTQQTAHAKLRGNQLTVQIHRFINI